MSPALPLCPSASERRLRLRDTTSAMVLATRRYLDALSADQRAASQFAMESPHRTLWEFEPLGSGNPRHGVPWPDLNPDQQQLVRELLRLGLGEAGLRKAELIREIEVIQHPEHGTRSYCLWVYGEPSVDQAWAWRFEGHHYSAAFTLRDGDISNTPLFIGVSPTEVHDNTANPSVAVGSRPMRDEDELSKALYFGLDDDQRDEAQMVLPSLFERTPHVARVEPTVPRGLRVADLRPEQRALVHRIVTTFVSNVAPPLAEVRYRELAASDIDNVVLSVARGNIRTEPYGHARPDGFYYRLQGSGFLYEYDDVQWGWQDTGHIHSIWRDFSDDFGMRVLASDQEAAPTR